MERVRSEKKAEQDRALADIQEEENRARERCKVSYRALALLQNILVRRLHASVDLISIPHVWLNCNRLRQSGSLTRTAKLAKERPS